VSERNRPVIVVTEPLSERSLACLREHGRVVQSSADKVADVIAEAEALVVRTYTDVNAALLDKARRLKVVGRAGVAMENIDVLACKARGIQVVHTPGANTLAVVDYTIGMIVQLNRRFWPMTRPLIGEEFHLARKGMYGRFLSDLTVGIVGCGRIGGRVGRAAVGLGMKVLYNDIRKVDIDYAARETDKATLYASSDIVTIHVPLTDLTRKFINAESLAGFRKGAQFINAARGQCVDYHALAAAVRDGRLGGAAIDCHDPEPPPPDYPMYGLEEFNVILTPHVAARVPSAMEAMCDVVYDVVAVLEGRPPRFPAQEDQYT
jgi:D-3-phosphoglycerate dehydrogenase